MVKGKWDKIVQECIRKGGEADKLASNPYSKQTEAVQYHAWSAGHFDKWGRV